MRRRILALSFFVLSITQAQAGGFQIPEMDVKAMGMGHAVTAVADNPSANWFNPAGLAFQEGHAMTVGGTLILPKVDFSSNTSNPLHPTSASADKKTLLVPHAYVAGTSEDFGISYGIGINAPFGLEMEYPTTAAFAGAAQYARLQAVNVNPNVAIKVNDSLSVAVGLDYVNMYQVDFNGTALKQNFSGDGLGYNVAALYKTDAFNIGISYRSEVKIKANGTSTLTATSQTVNNTITVTMPDTLNIGVAFHPADRWTISADADWVNWKKFDQLAFTYTPTLGGVGTSLTVPENWKATWAYRLGAEWAYSDTMRARFGYTYDPSPIKDVDFTPLLPGNDRQAVHLGYGVDLSDQATIDLAYIYVWLSDRNQTASLAPSNFVRNGTYKSSIHLFGASLTYHF